MCDEVSYTGLTQNNALMNMHVYIRGKEIIYAIFIFTKPFVLFIETNNAEIELDKT